MPTGGVDIVAGAGALASAFGSAAPLIGTALAGGEAGAALGGIESAISGGNVLKGAGEGALGGAITGGGIGLGGDLLGGTIGSTAADALGGVAGGALGSLATGGNPLTGAVTGGISGGIVGSGLLSGSPSTAAAAPASGGAGVSAAGGAAPPTVTPDTGDVTLGQTPAPANLPDLSGVGSPATSGTNVGTGTTGTQGLPSGLGGGDLGSQIASAAGANSTPAPANLPSTSVGQAAPTSVQQFLSNPSFANAGNIVTSNPGAAISAAGLGLDALKANQNLEGERQLKQEASNLAGQGGQLESYLQSGTLPPGLQTGINQAQDAAIATIKSRYAAQGASGSSAEQQDIAAVQQQAQAQGAQMAMQLLSTGISETGMASKLYESLLSNATAQDTALGSAIGNFATAAAGGTPGLSLNLGSLLKQTGAGGAP